MGGPPLQPPPLPGRDKTPLIPVNFKFKIQDSGREKTDLTLWAGMKAGFSGVRKALTSPC